MHDMYSMQSPPASYSQAAISAAQLFSNAHSMQPLIMSPQDPLSSQSVDVEVAVVEVVQGFDVVVVLVVLPEPPVPGSLFHSESEQAERAAM